MPVSTWLSQADLARMDDARKRADEAHLAGDDAEATRIMHEFWEPFERAEAEKERERIKSSQESARRRTEEIAKQAEAEKKARELDEKFKLATIKLAEVSAINATTAVVRKTIKPGPGRPKNYDAKVLKRVAAMMQEGSTVANVAREMGLKPRAVRLMLDAHRQRKKRSQ